MIQFYIDPGTGSMLFTIIIGIATTGVFLFRGLFLKLKYKVLGGSVDQNENKIPLVIFSDHKRYWNVFQPVCDELEKRGIPCEFWTMSPDDPALECSYQYIKPIFIGEGNKGFAKLNTMNARICLATTPGLDVLQWKRSKDVDHYVFLYHNIDDGTIFKMFGLDCYDAILMNGEIQRKPLEEMTEMRHLKKRELLTVGSSFMDGLLRKKEELQIEKTEDISILCAPSWGESALLSRYGAELIDALVKTGYKIIIRPHPQSFTAEKETIEKLQDQFADCPNLEWNRDNDNFAVMAKSHLLISDFSGIIFDYAFTFARPFLYADTNFDTAPYDAAWFEHEPLHFKYYDQMGKKIQPSDFSDMKSVIVQMLNDYKLGQNREAIKDFVWANRGHAAEKIVDYLEKKQADLKTESQQ